MQKVPITSVGYERWRSELQKLKGEERRKVVKAIEEARSHGDLSENAEYDAAKQAQGLLEARIADIESKLANAQVIDIAKLSGEKVLFGATVLLLDMDNNKEREVSIVGEDEADVTRGLISFSSPLARALIGKSAGDVAEVKLPSGVKDYEITSVKFRPLQL